MGLPWIKLFTNVFDDPHVQTFIHKNKEGFRFLIALQLNIAKHYDPLNHDNSQMIKIHLTRLKSDAGAYKLKTIQDQLIKAAKVFDFKVRIEDDCCLIVWPNFIKTLQNYSRDRKGKFMPKGREKEGEREAEKEGKKEGDEEGINYSKYLNLWNGFAKDHDLKKVKSLTSKRKQKIKDLFNHGIKEAEFAVLLLSASEQSYLMGNNKENLKISFDWILTDPTNAFRVLERAYESKSDIATYDDGIPF